MFSEPPKWVDSFWVPWKPNSIRVSGTLKQPYSQVISLAWPRVSFVPVDLALAEHEALQQETHGQTFGLHLAGEESRYPFWEVEKTTCGVDPGGLILTHSHFSSDHRDLAGRPVELVPFGGAAELWRPRTSGATPST